MSQTETLMLLALGVFATLFLVLLFGRGVWSLLGRWSGWKEARKVPRTIRDLQAERDSLKAEKAMMASKLENALSDMKLRLAEQMAEVSRNRNRVLDANAKLQAQSNEIETLKAEILRREEKVFALNAQIQDNVNAISQAWAKTAEHESDTTRAMTMHKEAIAAIDLRDERIRNLVSEARTLREIIATLVPGKGTTQVAPSAEAAVTILPARDMALRELEMPSSKVEPVANSFSARFSISNPLTVAEIQSPEISQAEPVAASAEAAPQEASEAGPLEQEISNVLSITERIRVLQKGIKR